MENPYPCKLKAISPTALHTFEDDPTAFVMTYVARLPRPKQLPVMSIGSAFDSRCKAYLTAHLCGGTEHDLFHQLFEASVEEHNRDWARKESKQLFDWYKKSGALNDLVNDMTGYTIAPRFEFSVLQTMTEHIGTETAISVPITGKPDCYFGNREGAKVIYDWKVNGYCSKASPVQGYVRCRDLTGMNEGAYRGIMVMNHKGIPLGYGIPLKSDWNDQLIMYSWMLGDGNVSFEQEDWILGIDQLACNLNGAEAKKLRVAAFRLSRDPVKAKALWARLTRMWGAVQQGHYFIELSYEDSMARTESLMNGGKDLAWMFSR